MTNEAFDMSVAAIRERYEEWRSLCEKDAPGEGRVASDFWRDIGALLKHCDEQGSRLSSFRQASENYRKGLISANVFIEFVEKETAVEEHAHNWTEREGDTQNLYCECGEVSRPLSPVVEEPLPGRRISRDEALAISRATLERAESERAALDVETPFPGDVYAPSVTSGGTDANQSRCDHVFLDRRCGRCGASDGYVDTALLKISAMVAKDG